MEKIRKQIFMGSRPATLVWEEIENEQTVVNTKDKFIYRLSGCPLLIVTKVACSCFLMDFNVTVLCSKNS
jgi:hypothetical protein